VLVHCPLGAIRQFPPSGPSRRPNTEGESKREKLSHSTDPDRSIKAVECRSERMAWFAMAVLDMCAPGRKEVFIVQSAEPLLALHMRLRKTSAQPP